MDGSNLYEGTVITLDAEENIKENNKKYISFLIGNGCWNKCFRWNGIWLHGYRSLL